MAKLKDDPITAQDLSDFVASNSDFAFEMRVLAQLRCLGFACSHSGTYRDPVTEKIRQFDIRAITHRGNFALVLAVECKNLRPNNPLLLSAVPRTVTEAFHDQLVFNPQLHFTSRSVRNVFGQASAYKPEQVVGKKSDQVGRDSSGTLVSNDEATFEKLNQAVNSCRDFVRDFVLKQPVRPGVQVIVPLLVVPTGLLWQVDYRADGKLQTPPRPVTRTNLFLDHAWSVETGLGETITYRLSHIEFVTVNALPGIVEDYFGTGGFFPE